MRPTVISAAQLAAYSPANHTGTSNVRVIGPETVGATALEILVGTIVKSHGAKPHAHPYLEQCAYMMDGTGESQAQGRVEALGPGSWSYVPAGVFHTFRVTSDQPGRLLVVYAPPYGENPAQTITVPEAASPQCGDVRVINAAGDGHARAGPAHRRREDRRALGRDRRGAHGRRRCARVHRQAGCRAGALSRAWTTPRKRGRAGLPARAGRLPVSPTRGRRGPALPDGPAGVRLPHQGTASVLLPHTSERNST